MRIILTKVVSIVFKRYTSLKRFGTSEVDGILDGIVHVFPKLDGTNGSVWLDSDGQIKAGSRNRELTLEQDNAGFYASVLHDKALVDFLQSHSNMRLYGEFLKPHNLRTYCDSAWDTFYIFDVYDDNNERFLTYDEYSEMLDLFNILYIPRIAILDNPSEDIIMEILKKNTYLIKEGEGIGEGIVLKNYDYRNRYDELRFAKLISESFHGKGLRKKVSKLKQEPGKEAQIVDTYLTQADVHKEYHKLAINGWDDKMIPQFLENVYQSFKEDYFDEIFQNSESPVNVRDLRRALMIQSKFLLPEVFGKK